MLMSMVDCVSDESESPEFKKFAFNSKQLDWRANLLVREILKAKLPEPGGGSTVELAAQRRVLP